HLHKIEQALAVTRRSVVAVEIVDGLSEVAGQPLALGVARLARRARVGCAAGQLRELSFVLKGRFCAGWTNQAIEIIACWHISRAHHKIKGFSLHWGAAQ